MSIARIATATSLVAILTAGCAHTRPNATNSKTSGADGQRRGSAAASTQPVDPAMLAATLEQASAAADEALGDAMHRAVG